MIEALEFTERERGGNAKLRCKVVDLSRSLISASWFHRLLSSSWTHQPPPSSFTKVVNLDNITSAKLITHRNTHWNVILSGLGLGLGCGLVAAASSSHDDGARAGLTLLGGGATGGLAAAAFGGVTWEHELELTFRSGFYSSPKKLLIHSEPSPLIRLEIGNRKPPMCLMSAADYVWRSEDSRKKEYDTFLNRWNLFSK